MEDAWREYEEQLRSLGAGSRPGNQTIFCVVVVDVPGIEARLNDHLKRSVTARWGRARSQWTPFDGITRINSTTAAMLAFFAGISEVIIVYKSHRRGELGYWLAPGVRNGAQHTHDYAGNESTNFASESRPEE